MSKYTLVLFLFLGLYLVAPQSKRMLFTVSSTKADEAERVQRIIEKNVESVNDQGRNMLFYVKHPDSVKALVAASADVNCLDCEKETPLGNAFKRHGVSSKLVMAMLDCKASLFLKNNEGKCICERFVLRDGTYFFDNNRLGDRIVKVSRSKIGAMRKSIWFEVYKRVGRMIV